MSVVNYDLIIVGGGIVGAGLAAALLDSDLKIALIDARLPSKNDPRLFALNSNSCQFLKNLGLWQELATFASPIHQVHVSYQNHFGAVRLLRDDMRLPELGHVIPAYIIESALHEILNLKQKNLTLYRPVKVESIFQEKNSTLQTIVLDADKKILQAPLVLGVDGTDSTTRKQLKIKTDVVDYQQSAIVTTTLLQRSHHHIAYERFTANGAIAMLPLTENEEGQSQCATIWTADSTKVAHLLALSDESFLSTLQKEFGYRLGRLHKVGKRFVYPLRKIIAEQTVKDGVLLMGNSAHTLHPIAAQGLNLALYEVATLVTAIKEKRALGQPFTANDLAQIGMQFQQQQAVNIGLSHRLSQLFTSKSKMLKTALQLGLVGLDLAPPLKRKFIQQIIGKKSKISAGFPL